MIFTQLTDEIYIDFAHERSGLSEVESSQESNRISGIWKKRTIRLGRKKKLQMGQENGFNASLWKNQENRAYMDFLIKNEPLFGANRKQRRLMKINVLMSHWIKTRSPDQCRSHHQKMLKYHRDISNIIRHIRALPVKAEPPKQKIRAKSSYVEDVPTVFSQQLSDLMDWVERNEDNHRQQMNQRWLDGVEEFY